MQSPYLQGPFAPTDHETPRTPLRVLEGEVPRELFGAFVRNGPNPRFAPLARHHWFDGDGMVHAVHFEDGQAFYASRYVRTADFARETDAEASLFKGLLESVFDNPDRRPKDTGNTDVIAWNGELLTTHYQCGAAWRLDPATLETRGTLPALPRVSAHAKVDPATGELLFFRYGPRRPHLEVGWMAPGGAPTWVDVGVERPVFPHDMAFTRRYAIAMAPSVVHSEEHAKKGRWGAFLDPDQPFAFFLVDRATHAVRRFEASPGYLYHVINAWEDGARVHLIAFHCPELFVDPDPADGPYALMMANLRLRASLRRWTFDLKTGETTETPLDDRNAEFPTADDRHLGGPSRYGYAMHIPPERQAFFGGVLKYDHIDGALVGRHDFGPGRVGSEAPFAPTGPQEDAGYLVSLVQDLGEDRSEVVVLDARTMEPAARLEVPVRVPLGFHTCWCPGAAIPTGAHTS